MFHSNTYEISASTSLNVVFSGTQGPTLIFLHFWGGSSRTFSPIITILSSQHHTIAVDFRGWGESTGPQTADAYSILDLASDIETLITKLALNEFILIGHSMGGKVAQLIAGRGLVQGLKGLVLLAPAPPSPLVIPAQMETAQMSAYSTFESAEFVVRNVLSASLLTDETIAMLVADIMKGNTYASAAWPVYAMLEDIVADVRKITVPVLIVAGGLDKLEPIDRLRSEVIGNLIEADTVMAVVKGSGHLLPLEAPLEVAKCIEGFVGKVMVCRDQAFDGGTVGEVTVR
jgi:3-oxoadipate enol-lactonase